MMTPELYLSLMTMHGTIMVFFVLTTAPQSRLRQLLPADADRRARTWRSRC
jgi:cytochrome c oxidase subunit 1